MDPIAISIMVARYALDYGPQVWDLIEEMKNMEDVTDEKVADLVALKDPKIYFKK